MLNYSIKNKIKKVIQIYQLTQSHHLNLFPKLTRRLKKGSRNSNSWVCHKSRIFRGFSNVGYLQIVRSELMSNTPTRRHSFRSSLRDTNLPLNDDKRVKTVGCCRSGGSAASEEMRINFEEWMKLATDNKINANNSWNIELIDYFHKMDFFKEGDSINFQKAACMLDGCMKIYKARVDSVVIETRKLLSSLITSSSKNNDEDDNRDSEDNEPERRSRKKKSSTLVKDYSSLTLKKFDLGFSIDPLFRKISADFDEGGAEGLLLNSLSIDRDGKLIFDSSDVISDKYDNRVDTDDDDQKIDITKLRSKYLPKLKQMFNKVICPSLDNFKISGNIIETEGENFLDFFDDEDNDDTDFNQFNDDAFGDNLDVNNEISELFDEENINPHARFSEKDCIMAMINSDNENEMFSYFDPTFLRNWTGPEHWKIKKVNKKPTETTGEIKEKKKKDPAFIDFINSEDLDERSIFSSGGSTINDPSLAESVSHRHLLPDDMHFSSKQFLQLFLKPQFMLNSRRRHEAQLDNRDDTNMNENYWADRTNDPVETSFLDDTNFTGEDTLHNDEYDDESDESEFGDNLITLTRRFRPVSVTYARKAKKIDILRLKKNMWETLTSLAGHSETGSFGLPEIMNHLRRFYPPEKMEDISVSLCFICLLYLSIEERIKIINDEDLIIYAQKEESIVILWVVFEEITGLLCKDQVTLSQLCATITTLRRILNFY
ncbi:condensin complex component cnd2 [Rhizophagus clarus]|uniref:Condensin complex subunit 2 n=1 Tax=Rhizophagus clarus TaxID=94130 RepID=A0A8H3R1M4_9GLOM|nr:condensin complex component cnd2 [Rhizophagus clarus]